MYVLCRKGFSMKKMAFWFAVALISTTPLFCKQDPVWGVQQARQTQEERRHRIRIQRRMLNLPNISRSPSPRPLRNVVAQVRQHRPGQNANRR